MLKVLTSPFKEFGPFGGLVYLIDQLLNRISSHAHLYFYELMVQPIPDRPLLPERFVRSLEFREIERGDEAIDRMPSRAEYKQARFEQGAICLGAYKKGELIGFIWFAFNQYDEDEVRCRFVMHPAERSVFDFDLYLFPEHRMGIGFVSLWNGANRFLRERGVEYTFSRLTRFNVASRRAHDHLGWQCLGKAIFLKLWRFEMMFANLRPYFHVSVSRSSRVRIHMHGETQFADRSGENPAA